MPTALLLIGHGSAHYPDAADDLLGHADALRTTGHFAEVAVGLLNGVPTVAHALASLTEAEVRVVPFFMEDGYFTRVAVPRAVGSAVTGVKKQRLRYCAPVGLHSDIADLIRHRVQNFCDDTGISPEVLSVLLVGHGSARSPGRRMAAHRHASRLDGFRRFRSVRVSFLEEPPFVPASLAAWRDRRVAVVGLFAGDGGHARDDLPAMIAAEHDRTANPPEGTPSGVHHPAGPRPHELLPANLGFIGNDPAMRRIIIDQAGR